MDSAVRCHRCNQHWTSLSEAHCATCCEHFTSTSAFDAHRVARVKGDVSTNRCWPLAQYGGLATPTGAQVLLLRVREAGKTMPARRLWGAPEMSEEVKAKRFGTDPA